VTLKPVQASPFAATPLKTDPAHTAGKQLEAFFLRQLLAESRPQAGGDDGFAGDTFKQMFDEAVADKMSSAGGIGLADMFAKQLSIKGGAQGSDVTGTPIANRLPQHTTVPMPELAGPNLDGIPRFTMPVAGTPTSGYGSRIDPIQHKEIKHPGFDLAAKTGTPVSAAAEGTVVSAGPAGTYGNLVTVRHGNGVETRYAHLSATTVKAGDHVDAGQQIGNVGTTGYSTGPHLHFEVRKDGQAIDPAPFLAINTHTPRSKP
jgi:murein DD-endopeptidase MepM/ murein hydrolase activator NlpD